MNLTAATAGVGVLGGGGPQTAFGMRLWAGGVGLAARVGADFDSAARTWLSDCGVPALSGVDTRALVRHIRDKGAMRGGVFDAGVPEERAREVVMAEPSMSGADLAR